MIRFLIPAYNECDQLQGVFTQISRVMDQIDSTYEIIIVDDGSDDGSLEIIKQFETKLPVIHARHDINQGVSAAFRTGFNRIFERGQPGDRIITMEANKHADPGIIPTMLKKMDEGADLVLASCYAPGGKVVGDPPLRLLLSKGINFLLRLFFPLHNIHTDTSFYRLWSWHLLEEMKNKTDGRFFEQEGFVCMADMLIKVRRVSGASVEEVPLVLISDIEQSGSKMKVGKTIMGYFYLFWSNFFPKWQK